jgi:hypothetical protein
MSEMKRAHFLPAPHFFNLQQACHTLQAAFGDGSGVYLVGSSLKTRDYRDVDVRCIMPDEEFERLFPGCPNNRYLHALWCVMCSTISLWLSKHTDLPIDFQIQSMEEANRLYPTAEGNPRNFLGLFVYETRQAIEEQEAKEKEDAPVRKPQ